MAARSAKAKALLIAPVLAVFFVVVVLAVRTASESPVSMESPARHAGARFSLPSFRPLRVTPPSTAIERTVNQGFAQSWVGESASEAARLPNAATSSAFPQVDSSDSQDPSTYALAFTQELLDLDFATSTRPELLAWASYNNAPNSLAVVPAALNLKVLAASLTTNPTPIPTSSRWRQLAAARTDWRVGGLVTSVSPIWTELLSSGWQPVDPLMVMYDVSGTLTVTTPQHLPTVESFFFVLTLGGASWHPGYGAVVLNDWTVN